MTTYLHCKSCNHIVKTEYNIAQPHTKEGNEYLPSDFVLHTPVCPGELYLVTKYEDSKN